MAANNKNLLHPMMSSHLKSGFVPPKKELCIYISELVTRKNFPRGLPFECSGCRAADEQHLCRTSFTGKGVMYCLDCVYKRIYQERRERAPGMNFFATAKKFTRMVFFLKKTRSDRQQDRRHPNSHSCQVRARRLALGRF